MSVYCVSFIVDLCVLLMLLSVCYTWVLYKQRRVNTLMAGFSFQRHKPTVFSTNCCVRSCKRAFCSANAAFACDCRSVRGLKRPAGAFLGALHEDKDIMSEMADFQEMSEVSSKPEKM